MSHDKKPRSSARDEDLAERIRNTAALLSKFAKENLDEKTAAQVIDSLSDIAEDDPD